MKSKKVLLDDGVNPQLEQRLSQDSPHRVGTVRGKIGQRVSDPTVIHYARENNQVIVTDDKSFRKVTGRDMNRFSNTLSKTSTHVEIDLSRYSFSSFSSAKLRIRQGQNKDDYSLGIGDKSHNGIIAFDQNEVNGLDDVESVYYIINNYLQRYTDNYIHRNHRMVRII